MSQSPLLHVVERLESLLHRLPAAIQKPVLHELTPLKQLFLQQRAPRFVVTGSNKMPLPEIIAALFAARETNEAHGFLMEIFRWHAIDVNGHGKISVLDARGADDAALRDIRDELRQSAADIFLHIASSDERTVRKTEVENLATLLEFNDSITPGAKIVGVSIVQPNTRAENATNAIRPRESLAKLETALRSTTSFSDRLLLTTELPATLGDRRTTTPEAANLLRFLAQNLPNEARIEMIRISRDAAAQMQVAQLLVKSTSAICTAVGTQPIPLADLPILTSLQLLMVSGIMYISGRERNLRAATEFVAALGVNVGAGMVFREGARALLKFIPGWGNVVCGMVAGAGTYALGRAASAYFIEGVSIKDARLTYLLSRKKPTGSDRSGQRQVTAGR